MVVALWTMFFLGVGVSIYLRAANILRSKLNGVKTYWEFLTHYQRLLVGKGFASIISFLLWNENPEFFNVLFQQVSGIQHTLPLTLATAAGFGALVDSLLDKAAGLAGLSKEIPLYSEPLAETKNPAQATSPEPCNCSKSCPFDLDGPIAKRMDELITDVRALQSRAVVEDEKKL